MERVNPGYQMSASTPGHSSHANAQPGAPSLASVPLRPPTRADSGAQPLLGLSGLQAGGGGSGNGMKCLKVSETQGSEGLRPQLEMSPSLGPFI